MLTNYRLRSSSMHRNSDLIWWLLNQSPASCVHIVLTSSVRQVWLRYGTQDQEALKKDISCLCKQMLSDLILKRNQDVTPGNRSCLAGCVWKERKKRKRMEGKMNNCFRDYTGWSSWKQNRTWTWKVQKRMKESLVATGSSNTRTSVRPHIPLPHSSKKNSFIRWLAKKIMGEESNHQGTQCQIQRALWAHLRKWTVG